MQTGNLQNQYDIWSQAIEDTIKKVEKVTKKKDLRKDVKELIRMRKKLRKEFQAETNYYSKKQIIERIEMTKEHIIDKLKESRGNKVRKIAESVKRNVDNGSKIWEVKRRVTKKKAVKRQIKDSKGKTLQDREDVMKEYEEYYNQLLTTRKPDNMATEIAKERVNEEFESILKHKNDSRREKIIFAMVKKAISAMKKRKAGDKLGWKAE